MHSAIFETSNTATGMANASEIALQRSINGWTCGRDFSFLKRRSSDSEAHRYCVGLSPMLEKTRRQACISGSCPSEVVASRASAIALNLAIWGPTEASFVIPSANSKPATSSGKSLQISPEWQKYMKSPRQSWLRHLTPRRAEDWPALTRPRSVDPERSNRS